MNELNLIEEGGGVPVYEYSLDFASVYGDRVDLPYNFITNTRTISMWVKPEVTTFNGQTRQFFLSQYGSPSGTKTIYIEFSDSGVVRAFLAQSSFGNSFFLLESNAGQYFNGGQWYYISISIDSVSGTKMYIDGVQQTNTIPSLTGGFLRSGASLEIGNWSLLTNNFDGQLKKLSVWNTARTQSEIVDDMTRTWTGLETGLKGYFPINEGSGGTIQDINSLYSGTIVTTNTSPTYIDDVMWLREVVGSTTSFIEKSRIDLFENQFVSVTKQSFDVNNLKQRLSGVTNNFTLPFTANNSEVFDYLDLNGNLSNKPYQINYVEFIQDGTPIIKRGRLNLREVSDDGYKVDITHGINDFFDRIRDKFLYEPLVLRQNLINEMTANNQVLSNDLSVQNAEGVVIPLVDYGFINPVPTYQQTPFAIITKVLDFINTEVGYTFIDSTNGRLNDLLFSPIKPFDVSAEIKELSGNYILSGGDRILLTTFYTTKKGIIQSNINFIKNDIVGSSNTVGFDFFVDGVLFDSYATSFNGESSDTSPFSSTVYEIGSKLEVFMYSNDPISHSMTVEIGKINYFAGSNFGVTSTFSLYYENLFKINQIDFIKYLMELLNLSFEVNEINKTVEFYSLNEVYDPNLGNTIDLSDYYSNVMYKKFEGGFGKLNYFKYQYEEKKQRSFDGSIIANNTNKEKEIISTDLFACFHESPLNIGVAYPYIMTSPCYELFDQTTSPNDLGNRIVKQVRISGATVSYTSGLAPFNVFGDQTVTKFDGLDWSNLIEDNYSSLRDYVLNRYQEVKLLMRVPRHLIDSFSFQNKIYISQLNSKFVVQSIKTRPDSLSEWILIKLN